MKSTPILRCVLIASLISTFQFQSAIRAQDQSARQSELRQEKEKALHNASEKLKGALGDKQDRLSRAAQTFLAATDNPDDLVQLKQATDYLNNTLEEMKKDPAFAIKARVSAATEAIQVSKEYQELAKAKTPSTPTPTPKQPPTGDPAGGFSLPDFVWPVAGGVAGVALVVLAVFGILRLRSGFWMKFDGHVSDIVSAHIGGVKKRNDEMAKNLAAIGEDQRKTSSRLESIEGEIQALGRRLRQGGLDGGYQAASVKQAFDEYARQPLPVEPEFPAAADQYLNKMKRNSTVVKPDFQNGILVNDVDGKGELVLIRDANLPDEAQPLFVVPRVTQFQSKQEFHAYYERYYDCQRPSAGDVWIIDPAVVSTVPGGWQLREKGVLEVR
ncbi:MAG: hypothetical protein QOH71_986 [Blastocatellia bacterium]|jgi:hypothetical protein|nr:hypothetical protein [Blastocatellia bacterium]